jgi:hypothetical protein
MYPADPADEPVLLPQILTDRIMREAIAAARPQGS